MNLQKQVEPRSEERLILAGESIVLCADISDNELEDLIDCELLCSDGIIPSELDIYSRIPPIPTHFSCFEIVWD